MGFAQELAARYPGEHIVIVKHAIGGSNLANEWSPDESIRQPDEPEQRRHCYTDLRRAMDHATEAEENLSWVGFAWMQGERDCCWDGMAGNYLSNLRILANTIRSDTNTPNLALAIGRVTPRQMTPDGTGYRHRNRAVVRAAQEAFCHQDPLATLIDTDDLQQRKDALHFVTPASLELGRRYARILA